MTIKHLILVFCSLTLGSCTSTVQSKNTTEYSNTYSEKKVSPSSAAQNVKLQDAPAYYNRAVLKDEKLNDIQGALADYNQAIIINPKFPTAHNNRAILKANKLNDQPGAIQDLRQAARLHREQGNTQGSQMAIENLRRLGATE
jgi:tetratricopeptide (TPR) repeat protein